MEGGPLKCIIVCKIASRNVAAVLGDAGGEEERSEEEER